MNKIVYLTCLISLIFIPSCSDDYNENLNEQNEVDFKLSQFDGDEESLSATNYPNIYVISKKGGSNTTEVHILNGANNYQNFSLHTATVLHQTGDSWDFALADYNRDGVKDLIGISKSETGSGTTEIHILNGANNFQSFILQTRTALHETGDNFEFLAGDYNRDGYIDIYAIKKTQTGTNSSEVHVLNGANNYQSFILQTGSCLHETNSSFTFCLGDYNRDNFQDIFAIKKSSTGTHSTEVHVLNGSNSFQSFILQTGTALHETGDNFDFLLGHANYDSYIDVISIKKNNTGTNSTEIHVLNGSSTYNRFILQTGTGLHETNDDFVFLN